jgi:hypothetical protein
MSLLNRIGFNKVVKETEKLAHYPVHLDNIINSIKNFALNEQISKKMLLQNNTSKGNKVGYSEMVRE